MKLSPKIQKLVDQAEAAERRGRAKPKRASSRKRNPGPRRHRDPVDEDAARDLELYIQTTSDLSQWGPKGMGKQIAQQVARKMKSGKYDPAKAPRAWSYLVEAAAKRYVREFDERQKWSSLFTPATRDAVAESLARTFEARFKAGDWTG